MERNGKPQRGHEIVSDMDLLFGPPTANTTERGASAEVFAENYDLLGAKPASMFQAKKAQRDVMHVESKLPQGDFDFSPCPQLDLTLAVRYVELNQNSEQVFDHIVDFVKNYQADQPNYEIYPEAKKVLGYIFEDSRFASYSLQLFRNADTMGLSCDKIDGFAPILNPFWSELQQVLTEAQFVSHDDDETFEEDDDEDIDLNFLDSDTEDGGFVFDLSAPSMKYLNLTENHGLIENWVEDIKDPNFSQETLLSLSHNCQDETNVRFLANNYAQSLFDSVIASMSSMTTETDRDTLPSVRSACVFLSELAEFKNVNVAEGDIKVLIDQLAKWASSQKKTTEVVRSEEIASLLATSILPKFSELVSGVLKNIQTDVLEAIQKKTDFDAVRKSVDDYRQLYAQPVR